MPRTARPARDAAATFASLDATSTTTDVVLVVEHDGHGVDEERPKGEEHARPPTSGVGAPKAAVSHRAGRRVT